MHLYHPTTVDEAISLLAANPEARCLAGGQTLVAMLNLGLMEPSALISLRRIDGLDQITRRPDGGLLLGATLTQAALAAENLPGAQRVLSDAAKQVAHPAIRNFGTIGGGLCHADPAADLPPAFVAANATFAAAGPDGARNVGAEDFFVDYLTTVLEEAEMLTGLEIPPPAEGSVGHYLKYARVDGDYATVSVAVTLTLRDGACSAARIVLGSCAPKPLRLDAADAALVGAPIDAAAMAKAGALLQEAAEPIADMRGSAEYRRKLIPGLVARAIEQTLAKAKMQ